METESISVISIHPGPDSPHGVDVKDILSRLAAYWDRWNWCVRNLDWLGADNQFLCDAVQKAGARGLWISSQELFAHAARVHHTFEGTFLAFPREVDPSTVSIRELAASFPASRAELEIRAVDGSFFDVYAKEPSVLSPLRLLPGVRDEIPCDYF